MNDKHIGCVALWVISLEGTDSNVGDMTLYTITDSEASVPDPGKTLALVCPSHEVIRVHSIQFLCALPFAAYTGDPLAEMIETLSKIYKGDLQ